MSNSRRPSNDNGGTVPQQSPDSLTDNSKVRERDRDQERQSDSSFYRRDYAQSRDRTRIFDPDKTSRSYSFSDRAGPGIERSNISSRYNMQDHRLQAMQSPTGSSGRNSRQSSPKHNPGSRPVSPKSDSARPGAAPKEINTSATLPYNPRVSSSVVEESAAGSKPDSPDQAVVKDPRLRRINTKVKLNSEHGAAAPSTASSQPSTSGTDRFAASPNPAMIGKGGISDSTTNPTHTQSFSLSNPHTPFTERGDVTTAVSDEEHSTLRRCSDGDVDTNMIDVDLVSTVAPSETKNSNTSIQSPESLDPASNLMESMVQLLTDFTDKVSSTSTLKDKRDIAKQKYWRCKQNDERNRKTFKDFPITIEQGRQARQLAEQEFASIDKKLKDHVQAQTESVQKFAGLFVSQIGQQKSAQQTHPEQDKVFQQTSDKIEELSAQVNIVVAEIKQTKQGALRSVKEAYELVDRATSTCKEAQQAAQRTIAQINELTLKVDKHSRDSAAQINELTLKVDKNSRDSAALDRDVAEDRAQIKKLRNLTEYLDEDLKTLRKRMADSEKDVKCLWDDKARSTTLESMRKDVNKDAAALKNTLESMRKDVNKDVAALKNTQGQFKSQVKSLEEKLKSCLQSYQVLAPEVEKHGKNLEKLNAATKASGSRDQEGTYGVETENGAVIPYGRLESLTLNLQSEFQNLQQSFQEITFKVQSCASRSEVIPLSDSISSLKTEIENLDATRPQQELETYHKDREGVREELKGLLDEVDALHAGQEQMRIIFTTHNEDIATRVEKAEEHIQEVSVELKKGYDKAEEHIQEVSVELKKSYDKAKEESENMARQVNGISKRVDAMMPAPTARPTPPSAPPTPQMHQAAQLPGGGSSSPIVDNGVANITRDMKHLTSYISSQLSSSPNLPARLNALEQALVNLQSRYNNLTTEPVVWAMVQQMQLMYPYASTAQHDIATVRAALGELEKLPPKIEILSTRVDRVAKDIEGTAVKITDQEKEHMSCDKKLEPWFELVKEERDKLKRHVQEQHDTLRQHVEGRCGQMETRIAATEDSVSKVATNVTMLKQVAELWKTANRAESKSQQIERDAPPKAVTQLQDNLSPVSYSSPNNQWVSTQTSGGTPEESDREADKLLKKFDASASSRRVSAYRRRVVLDTTISDTDDSDAPLAASRTNSSKSITVATPKQETSAVPVKRKRPKNAPDADEERAVLSELPIPPSRRKVARRL